MPSWRSELSSSWSSNGVDEACSLAMGNLRLMAKLRWGSAASKKANQSWA